MTTILVAADAKWVRDLVRSAFVGPGQVVIEVQRGQEVKGAFGEQEPDLVILDMQIGNMGGVAVAIDLRLEESASRLGTARILLLLDREADRFIARRAGVDAMLVKPVDAGTLRRCAKELLARPLPTYDEVGNEYDDEDPDEPEAVELDAEPADAAVAD